MPGLVVKPRSRIFHGHDWVYASEIKKSFGNPQPGEVISLKDFKDKPLGSAIYNPRSQIVARRFSRRKQDLDRAFFLRRLQLAFSLRERLPVDPTLCRLAWSESDGLPGLIVDRYRSHLVVQTLTLAMDQRIDLITGVLQELLTPDSIVVRNDSPMRKAEGLEPVNFVAHGENPDPVLLETGGLHLEATLLAGQKTGLYLDQLDTYDRIASLAPGKRVLDCFSNQGGFGLACARAGAASVTCVDISADAIAAVRRNAELNDLKTETVEANAFDYLKNCDEQFDLIILDPPSFTRSKKALGDAMRGYKEIHLRALKLLDHDGYLATFSCSHHVSRELFLNNVRDAAVDARRTLRLVESYTQRADHPILPTIPETEYLKGFCLQLLPGR
ncbi:MAG: rRNA large subunit methyltransferase I [Roseibacillus sp.]|jgi:23S rRNA (cytosine1962-C5)-methyltransferase|nr:rRNA large subunit methyltransferase I [Roseibacillus sp.]MCP4730959.1 class I SAM-dependent rRNA methyltransferase [Roseibacillus sp.]MDP7308508.1 class I SAM-dependent rRNA methyltransferase [Roseibacillus sp.]HJM62853.1 class I SAM-dependent rRNA methyltransferase [Roseibacillus sp.]|tara:strand:- start:2897 stop:4057 length:1161 start_codon:yes stop_codon:yes gene_type:complete